MKIQPIQRTSFKQLYYGSKVEDLTQLQKNALEDINYYIEQNNIIKKLEDIKCDLYIAPKDDGYAMDVAVVKGFRDSPKRGITYTKIIMLGGFATIINRYKSAVSGLANALSTDVLGAKFNRFFYCYERQLFKRYVNYVR